MPDPEQAEGLNESDFYAAITQLRKCCKDNNPYHLENSTLPLPNGTTLKDLNLQLFEAGAEVPDAKRHKWQVAGVGELLVGHQLVLSGKNEKGLSVEFRLIQTLKPGSLARMTNDWYILESEAGPDGKLVGKATKQVAQGAGLSKGKFEKSGIDGAVAILDIAKNTEASQYLRRP